jgi:ABC-type amino acid transport substrate-binding protein
MKMLSRRNALAIATLIPALLGASLCVTPTRSAEDVLVFGVDPTYRPLAFYDENKNLVGFDIDLANAMAQRMGAKAKFETMSFDGLIPALQAKRIDIEAELSVRPQRKEQVDFSTPFFSQNLTPVMRIDRKDFDPKSLEELKGEKIGVTAGTSADLALANVAGLNIARYNTTTDAFRDLILKRVDVVVVDSLTAGYQVKHTFPTELRAGRTGLASRTEIASAIRKGNTELLERVNKAIAAMKADGALDAIIKKWFGEIEY